MTRAPSFAPVHQAAAVWLDGRSRRERVLLLGLGVLAACALCWYGAALPLVRARQDAVARIETAAVLQSRLRNADPGAPAAPPTAPIDGDLSEVVRQRAVGQGLSLSSLDAQGPDVVAGAAGAPYDAVIGLIAKLESVDAAVVRDLRIEAAGGAGQVNLQMRVTR